VDVGSVVGAANTGRFSEFKSIHAEL
jgi:hypothetical protein